MATLFLSIHDLCVVGSDIRATEKQCAAWKSLASPQRRRESAEKTWRNFTGILGPSASSPRPLRLCGEHKV